MKRLELIKEGAQFDVNTAADKIIFSVADNIEVIEVGLVIEGTDAGGATVKFDRRVLAGSDTGRGDGDLGEITIPASNQQGKVLHQKIDPVVLDEGDQIVVEVTAESVTALNVVPFYKYVIVPNSRQLQDDAVSA